MKPSEWIAGMSINDDGEILVLLSRVTDGWMSNKGYLRDYLSVDRNRRPATYADLHREPKHGDLFLGSGDGPMFNVVLTYDGGWAVPFMLDSYPLDRDIYEAAQAESGRQMDTCLTCGREFEMTTAWRNSIRDMIGGPFCGKVCACGGRPEPVADDFAPASSLDGPSEPGHTWTVEENHGCDCVHGDCPDCLAFCEIVEAWELHAVWLAVHAPAGDVDKRAAEDHATAARKRERDAWLWGIAR